MQENAQLRADRDSLARDVNTLMNMISNLRIQLDNERITSDARGQQVAALQQVIECLEEQIASKHCKPSSALLIEVAEKQKQIERLEGCFKMLGTSGKLHVVMSFGAIEQEYIDHLLAMIDAKDQEIMLWKETATR